MTTTHGTCARFAFAAHPERLYILEGGQVAYQGGPGPMDYHPDEVEDWLRQRFNQDSKL